MTIRVPGGARVAGVSMVVLGALTGCGGDDGPSALEKELGRKCAGRVAADSVDLRLSEETETKVNASWHPEGDGQCWVVAHKKTDWFEPFALEVKVAGDGGAAQKTRRTLCTTLRGDSDHYTAYATGPDYCSAYSLGGRDSSGYVAHGVVGRYNVAIRIAGFRPVEGVDAPLKKTREQFERVMGDLREHYGR
ncbi:hypothetical protein ACF061_13115 [Streptomyces sp. NPDC015220]|uniref:hypothetical protein n=1 Tax=Streptomyces sp. NPDC015220 TaxID=3364947 RepID=UPI00370285CA